jgi:uncharacterized DUF497 family protein
VLYEWDARKDEENRRKHGLRLRDGIPALNDPQQLEWIDNRFEYGEERTITLGRAGRRVLCVVHASRGPDRIRIISVRRATHREQNAYHDLARR